MKYANNDITLDEQKNLIIQYARENGSITKKSKIWLVRGTTKGIPIA